MSETIAYTKAQGKVTRAETQLGQTVEGPAESNADGRVLETLIPPKRPLFKRNMPKRDGISHPRIGRKRFFPQPMKIDGGG